MVGGKKKVYLPCLEKEQRLCNQDGRQEWEKGLILRVRHRCDYQWERWESSELEAQGALVKIKPFCQNGKKKSM